MVFCIVEFDKTNVEETQQHMFEQACESDETLLTHAVLIPASIIPKEKWLLWIDKEKLSDYDWQFYNLSNEEGIKSLTELPVEKSIKDEDWKWENEYINHIFAEYA